MPPQQRHRLQMGVAFGWKSAPGKLEPGSIVGAVSLSPALPNLLAEIAFDCIHDESFSRVSCLITWHRMNGAASQKRT